MPSWMVWVITCVSAVPGIAALLAWGVGYGSLLNRVKTVEGDIAEMKTELAEFRATAILVARLDERTEGMRGVLDRMDGKLNDALGVLIHEKRSFASPA